MQGEREGWMWAGRGAWTHKEGETHRWGTRMWVTATGRGQAEEIWTWGGNDLMLHQPHDHTDDKDEGHGAPTCENDKCDMDEQCPTCKLHRCCVLCGRPSAVPSTGSELDSSNSDHHSINLIKNVNGHVSLSTTIFCCSLEYMNSWLLASSEGPSTVLVTRSTSIACHGSWAYLKRNLWRTSSQTWTFLLACFHTSRLISLQCSLAMYLGSITHGR